MSKKYDTRKNAAATNEVLKLTNDKKEVKNKIAIEEKKELTNSIGIKSINVKQEDVRKKPRGRGCSINKSSNSSSKSVGEVVLEDKHYADHKVQLEVLVKDNRSTSDENVNRNMKPYDRHHHHNRHSSYERQLEQRVTILEQQVRVLQNVVFISSNIGLQPNSIGAQGLLPTPNACFTPSYNPYVNNFANSTAYPAYLWQHSANYINHSTSIPASVHQATSQGFSLQPQHYGNFKNPQQ